MEYGDTNTVLIVQINELSAAANELGSEYDWKYNFITADSTCGQTQ